MVSPCRVMTMSPCRVMTMSPRLGAMVSLCPAAMSNSYQLWAAHSGRSSMASL
jgi:hypothetical protein